MANTKWVLDPDHSEIHFKVKHLMITTVTGSFRKFTVEVNTGDDNFSVAERIEFTAETNSIDTNNERRDDHLRSADFFDVEKYPQIDFLSTKQQGIGKDGELSGDLTISGITHPIIVNFEFGGIVTDGYGQKKAGYTINGKLNRKDFGLTWGAITEAGNVVVSDEVKFFGEIQLIKQAQRS